MLKKQLLQIIKEKQPYFLKEDSVLIHGDSFEKLKEIKSRSIDMIFADPPYFLSGDGITCHSGKMVSVKKANWDEEKNIKAKLDRLH